jgi:hypothetical protein
MVLASQAAMKLARELNLDEDQQKMLSARLNEMADPHSGFVDFALAQNVAEGIQTMPTQAGPANSPTTKSEEADRRRRKPWQRGAPVSV